MNSRFYNTIFSNLRYGYSNNRFSETTAWNLTKDKYNFLFSFQNNSVIGSRAKGLFFKVGLYTKVYKTRAKLEEIFINSKKLVKFILQGSSFYVGKGIILDINFNVVASIMMQNQRDYMLGQDDRFDIDSSNIKYKLFLNKKLLDVDYISSNKTITNFINKELVKDTINENIDIEILNEEFSFISTPKINYNKTPDHYIDILKRINFNDIELGRSLIESENLVYG